MIDAPSLYNRSGNPYMDPRQEPYSDNHLRFALLGYVGAELASGRDPYWRPEVVHGHDWHAGLLPAYLAARGRPAKSVFTIHNLAYQACLRRITLANCNCPATSSRWKGLSSMARFLF